MKIDQQTVEKIAHLARLEVSETEVAEMQTGLSKILNWMEQLNEVNTDGIEPLIHMNTGTNLFRKDEAINTLNREDGLKNAPKRTETYITVPKVVE
ncbi:MAG: Asp-tRNA(Asn)/Glu-tRNA(Gln) amidotransferase subunit GatC [Spirosomaceae bacterium]|nr:Asp-tRNA(Asn)/Glu-tRNA(Gln) amidotransferase subunit GatC [Spirosomataceae bacterium]